MTFKLRKNHECLMLLLRPSWKTTFVNIAYTVDNFANISQIARYINPASGNFYFVINVTHTC